MFEESFCRQLQDYGVRQPDRRDPPKVPSAFDQAKAENAKRDAAREIEREKQRLDLEQLRKDKVSMRVCFTLRAYNHL
jgi:hypothetical protein